MLFEDTQCIIWRQCSVLFVVIGMCCMVSVACCMETHSVLYGDSVVCCMESYGQYSVLYVVI